MTYKSSHNLYFIYKSNLSIYLSIYLYIVLSVYRLVYIHMYIYTYIKFVCPSIYRSVYLSIYLSVYRSVCISIYLYIYIYIYIYMLNIIDILCRHIFLWIRSNSRIILWYSGGIDLGIVHSCMYPEYFLPDFGPSSGENLLQK